MFMTETKRVRCISLVLLAHWYGAERWLEDTLQGGSWNGEGTNKRSRFFSFILEIYQALDLTAKLLISGGTFDSMEIVCLVFLVFA